MLWQRLLMSKWKGKLNDDEINLIKCFLPPSQKQKSHQRIKVLQCCHLHRRHPTNQNNKCWLCQTSRKLHNGKVQQNLGSEERARLCRYKHSKTVLIFVLKLSLILVILLIVASFLWTNVIMCQLFKCPLCKVHLICCVTFPYLTMLCCSFDLSFGWWNWATFLHAFDSMYMDKDASVLLFFVVVFAMTEPGQWRCGEVECFFQGQMCLWCAKRIIFCCMHCCCTRDVLTWIVFWHSFWFCLWNCDIFSCVWQCDTLCMGKCELFCFFLVLFFSNQW